MYQLTIGSSVIPSETPFVHDTEGGFLSNGELNIYPGGVTFSQEWIGEGDSPVIFATGEAQAMPRVITPEDLRIAEIEAELTAIDAASARPLRAILTATTNGGTADQADVARLAELEAQAVALRAELAELAEES